MRVVGIDVGGTFTDFVLYDSGYPEPKVLKISSSANPTDTMAAGVVQLCAAGAIEPGQIDRVIHGTTVATNSVIERKGARTAMLTTAGFRDVIHIGRHQRPQNYSIQQDIPWQANPLVERYLRFEIPERIVPPRGDVLLELDEQSVRRAAAEMRRVGVTAVAVCFLFSYLNPTHERRTAEILAEELAGAFVCTSSDVIPQFREFERFTTTALNAFTGPRVRDYLQDFEKRLRDLGVGCPIHIMQSNGGTATPASASRRPVALLLSGPVGGVIGGVLAARGTRRPVVTLDVGGTSADIAVVTEKGVVEARSRDTWIAGYPVLMPTIDVESIGAGGGSIAYLDAAGGLHVGPRSAGAFPGPACYGRGGTDPTVTDANVMLGRLPQALAGGLHLDPTKARDAIGRLAERLKIDVAECAAGVLKIVNENMAAAIRIKTIQRGLDPRDFLQVAFGGAGPAQAVELADILQIPKVLVPPNPGVTAAAGLLAADIRLDVSVSILAKLSTVDPFNLNGRFVDLERELRGALREQGAGDAIRIERAADARYVGQSFELRVPLGAGPIGPDILAGIAERFNRLHHEEFGHSLANVEVELANLRLTGLGLIDRPAVPEVSDGSLGEALIGSNPTVFTVNGGLKLFDTPVYARERLPVGQELSGPAIIIQLDSTTVVPPTASVNRDRSGNLLISVNRSAAEEE
jgi:N-methylhydantoinase A